MRKVEHGGDNSLTGVEWQGTDSDEHVRHKETTMHALFCCDQYYPSGGWLDHKAIFDNVEDAKKAGHAWVNEDKSSFATPYEYGHFHIVDLTTFEVVYNSQNEDF